MPKVLVVNGNTYLYDDNGKLMKTMEGDQSKNPAAFEPRGPSLKGSPGAMEAGSNLGRDLLTDAASSIPLMAIPGLGIAKGLVKGGASLGLGTVVDQAISKLQGEDRPLGSSMWDAATNTGIDMLTNHMIQNFPTMSSYERAKGYGVKGMFGGLLQMLKGEPILPEVEATTPVLRGNWGNKGQWRSNKEAYQAYLDYKKKYSILNSITNALGLGINAGIDYNVDQPEK